MKPGPPLSAQVAEQMRQAMAAHRAGRLAEAERLYRRVLAAQPGNLDAINLLGAMAARAGDCLRGLQYFERAIAIRGDLAEAHFNRALMLKGLLRHEEALASYDEAIRLQPGYVDAHFNRANLQRELGRYEAALAGYEGALALQPGHASAHLNRGHVLNHLQRREEAIASYDRALAANPNLKSLWGTRLQVKLAACDWRDFEASRAHITERLERQEAVVAPFTALLLFDSPRLQLLAAQAWVRDHAAPGPPLPAIPRRARRAKWRVGYFSPDFRSHAVAVLTAELFRSHDRSRFEVYGVSWGHREDDRVSQWISAEAFDHFADVRGKGDREVALLAREMDLDIAVDLTGFTENARPAIFALRVAPLQVNFLGYPGTSGAACMDYLIADPILIPDSARQHYSEKIIYLPVFQPNDSRRSFAGPAPTRQDLGLPANGFAFCCFNNTPKINPDNFAVWMRILRRCPESALIVYADSEAAVRNLRTAAQQAGIAPDRLAFGGRIPFPEYLARFQAADLFLDTFPFNGGTTASDALWAGLPVLTCIGASFAGRMAASLLQELGLPELITASPQDYEDVAVRLAGEPGALTAIRQRLAANQLVSRLYDPARYTRGLETGYRMICERHAAGLAPDHVHVTTADPG